VRRGSDVLEGASLSSAVDVPLNPRPAFANWQRWLLLVAFAVLLVFRLPGAWVHGRFQDEEATVFLAYAWHYPWREALFRPFAGYWNLGATASTVLLVQLVKGGIVPLEQAPYVTMGIAFLVQLLPAVLILTGSAHWLGSRLATIAALLIIAIAPATEEVFFNVMHIQFHLALCAALILALDVPSGRWGRAAYGMLLFAAPLCGPGAIVLVPLFGLRALLDKDRQRLAQLMAVAAGAAVQLLFFYSPSGVRGHSQSFGAVAGAMFVRMIALPFLGTEEAYRAAALIYDSRQSGGHIFWLFAAATLIAFAALFTLAVKRRDSAVWLLLSALSIGSISMAVGMVTTKGIDAFSVFGSERYNFLPEVLIGLTLVALATRRPIRERPLYAVLCGILITVGALHYWKPLKDFAKGPSWPAEVRAWRADHRHPLAVWPGRWAADLSDQAKPCSAPGVDIRRSSDPRYCENGWLAAFFENRRN
jgi:hypothetical protein